MVRPTVKPPVRSAPRTPGAARKRSAHDRAGVTESMEDYLECIFDLERTKGYACVSDVAEALRPLLEQTQEHVRDLRTALGE